jgi:lipoprotein-releasing system permease protein
MLDWLQPTLGFVSASLVALIALSFGALFLFFSGSAALVLGHFLRFARAPRVAAVAIATAALLAGGVALLGGFAPWWAPPLAWIACGLLGYALVRVRTLQVAVQRIGGAFLLASGLLYVVSLSVTTLAPYAVGALALCGSLLAMAAAGLGPLVVAGLVQHYRERRVEWFLSLRYLVAKRRQTFISVITVICVVGVALGVAVITVVLSVMNGFSRVWEEKIVGNRAHFVVHSRLGPYDDYLAVRERVLDVDGVVGATPFLVTEAILRDDSGAIQAVLLKGVEPSTVGQATELERDLVAGSLSNLQPQPGAAGTEAFPGVVIGAELADRFLLRVGDPVILISPLGGQPTPLGPAPRLERFRVAGVFRANFFQFDETFVYTSLAGAQRFMKLDDVATGIEVRTDDPYRSQLVARTVEQTLGEFFFARDWKEFYPGFFQALKTERAMMFVLLSFIMVVAGFIIVATLIMMIMEKSRDISILKAMGCEDDGVLRVFAIEGFLIGLAGLGLGLGMGLVITWNLEMIQAVVERTLGFDVLPASVYQLESLPFSVDPTQMALVSLIAMVLAIGATLLPAWQASRLDPAEALRYE